MTGAELITAERERQLVRLHWGPDHDDTHDTGELAMAAEAYLIAARHADLGFSAESVGYTHWPWDVASWHPSPDPVRNLVKAGALVAAEIDRLQRRQESESKP